MKNTNMIIAQPQLKMMETPNYLETCQMHIMANLKRIKKVYENGTTIGVQANNVGITIYGGELLNKHNPERLSELRGTWLIDRVEQDTDVQELATSLLARLFSI